MKKSKMKVIQRQKTTQNWRHVCYRRPIKAGGTGADCKLLSAPAGPDYNGCTARVPGHNLGQPINCNEKIVQNMFLIGIAGIELLCIPCTHLQVSVSYRQTPYFIFSLCSLSSNVGYNLSTAFHNGILSRAFKCMLNNCLDSGVG